jgi:hypothetical protein
MNSQGLRPPLRIAAANPRPSRRPRSRAAVSWISASTCKAVVHGDYRTALLPNMEIGAVGCRQRLGLVRGNALRVAQVRPTLLCARTVLHHARTNLSERPLSRRHGQTCRLLADLRRSTHKMTDDGRGANTTSACPGPPNTCSRHSCMKYLPRLGQNGFGLLSGATDRCA